MHNLSNRLSYSALAAASYRQRLAARQPPAAIAATETAAAEGPTRYTYVKLWHNTDLKSVSIIVIIIICYINMHSKGDITSALSTTRYQKKLKVE